MRLHSIGVRVYYEDTDAGGIVYYANYLKFFERARTDWLRAAGINHQDLSLLDGLGLVVRECAVQYLRPARLDDLLAVEVGIENPARDFGRASLRLTQRALLVERTQSAREPVAGTETVLATATVRIACISAQTGRPAPLPQRVLDVIAGQLAGAEQPQDSSRSALSASGTARPSRSASGSDTVFSSASPTSFASATSSASPYLSQRATTTVTPDGTTAQE
jgi:acyl-CoA thioester hydrolase